MGTITHGRSPTKKTKLGQGLIKGLKEAVDSIEEYKPMSLIREERAQENLAKPLEKQVVIEVPVKDKRMRQHSLLVSQKTKDLSKSFDSLASAMEEIIIVQKNDKSAAQMQHNELDNQIRKIANASAKHQIEISGQLKAMQHSLEVVAAHTPNVTEIRHIEKQRVSKLLVFLNILLLGSVLALLCK
jgi:hypothetical protein